MEGVLAGDQILSFFCVQWPCTLTQQNKAIHQQDWHNQPLVKSFP